MKLAQIVTLTSLVVISLFFYIYPLQINAFSVEKMSGIPITGDIAVYPVRNEIRLTPGESGIIELNVTNRSGEDRRFAITTEDVIGTNDPNNYFKFVEDKEGISLIDMIFVEEREFALKHGERAKITVSISVPVQIEPGSLSGLINISSYSLENFSSDSSSKSVIIPQISVLLITDILGDSISSGELKSFSLIGDQVVFEGNAPKVRILFENNGTKHLNPYGYIEIKNFKGKVVQTKEINPWYVLPNSLRTRDIALDGTLGFGWYKVEIKMNRGYQDIVDEASVDFTILPISYVAIIGAVVLIAISILVRFMRRRSRAIKTDQIVQR